MAAKGMYPYPGSSDLETYELENQIADPEQRLELFMEGLIPFEGASVADVGAGSGFHACRLANRVAHVFALEPAPAMLRELSRRVSDLGLGNVSALAAEAEHIPLHDDAVELVHARFAYFFGPMRPGWIHSCEPGIEEALRILKPGGRFFIIDNALRSGQFARLLAQYGYTKGWADTLQRETDDFYAERGFEVATVESAWVAPSREALERVLAMEFPADTLADVLDQIPGTTLTYDYRVYSRAK